MRATLIITLALALCSTSCARCRCAEPAVPQPCAATAGDEAEAGTTGDETLPTDADTAEADTQQAPPPLPEEDDPAPEALDVTPEAEVLAEAFALRLTVWTRHDGTRVLTPHCRNGPVPCEERLRAFAALIVEIANEHDIDPVLVAAMAMRESGLDPSALGRRREAGIIQLHPRGAGHDIRYVQDAAYRARCQRRVDACQREVLERGIETLARGIAECGGLRGGLGAYASGHCTTSIRYITRVLEERTRMRQLVRQARRR